MIYGRGSGGEGDMAEAHPELHRLRDSIDNIDAALVHLLAERFKCTQAVGEYKATHGLPPADPAREQVQIARLRARAQGRQAQSQISRNNSWLHRQGSDPPSRSDPRRALDFEEIMDLPFRPRRKHFGRR